MNCEGLSTASDLSCKQVVTSGKILFWPFNQNQGNEFIHEFFIQISFLLPVSSLQQFRVELPKPSVMLNAHLYSNNHLSIYISTLKATFLEKMLTFFFLIGKQLAQSYCFLQAPLLFTVSS